MIRLNCFIRVCDAENRDQVIGDALAMTAHARNEKGCIAYDIFQSKSQPEIMMFCETWENQEALDAHAKSDVYKRYIGNIRELAEMKLERFEF